MCPRGRHRHDELRVQVGTLKNRQCLVHRQRPKRRCHSTCACRTTSFQDPDWNTLLAAFKAKCGKHIHEFELTSQSFFAAAKKNWLMACSQFETLSQMFSVADESKETARKPEQSRHLGLNLDSTLSVQTRRRFITSSPTTIEDLRTECNLWLLAQVRQPGRHLYCNDVARVCVANYPTGQNCFRLALSG